MNAKSTALAEKENWMRRPENLNYLHIKLISQIGNSIDTEEENFYRLGSAIVGIGTNILREILQFYILPKGIASKVRSYPYLKLYKEQKSSIAQAAVEGYKTFDISLCYIILRNVCTNLGDPNKADLAVPTRGWGKQPLTGDKSVSDDIERIRFLRNDMYGHLPHASIPIIKFTEIWNQFKDICTRMKSLYCKDFLGEFRKLDSCKVTKVEWSSVVELVNKSREHDIVLEDHLRRIRHLENEQQHLQTQQDVLGVILHKVDTQQQKLQTHQVKMSQSFQQLQTHQHVLQTKHDALNETMSQKHKKLENRQEGLQTQQDTMEINIKEIADRQHGLETQQGATDDTLHQLKTDQHKTQAQQRNLNENLQRFEIRQHGLQSYQDVMNQSLQKWETNNIQIQRNQDAFGETLRFQSERILTLNTRVQRHDRDIDHIRKCFETGHTFTEQEVDVSLLNKRLLEINDKATQVIPVAPLQQSDKLPIELLYASVVISEDPRYNRKKDKPPKRSRETVHKKVVKTPNDMFIIDNKPVERVYMLGDAAHGKTTYCLWLLKQWCNSQKRPKYHPKNEWEKALQDFDFVFHLPLRNANQSRVSFSEMICKDILHALPSLHKTVEYVLLSESYRCFIIIDGLDEWNPNKYVIDNLRCKALPNFDNMSNCVYFITMRPWIFEFVAGEVRHNDTVLEIKGLDEVGIRNVTRNVLVNYYGLNPWTYEYEGKFLEIMSKLDDETLRSFFQIPLLAVVCVQIWYEGYQVSDSMTSFYAAMINMMIERAQLKHDTQGFLCHAVDINLPKGLSAYENIKKYMYVLSKLGKVAYDGLQSDQEKLEFQKIKLEKEIGERELKFSLNVGLISQKEAPSVLTRNVSVHFFHKSIQEFLAAVHIVTREQLSVSFFKLLTSVTAIMKLSNVIKFIFGLSPSLVSATSRHILSVIERDPHTDSYRDSPDFDGRTEELFKLHVGWYKEMKYGKTLTSSDITFYVSDVYLIPENRDREAVKVCGELLSERHVIRSMFLRWVPTTGKVCVSNADLNSLLANTNSLVMLHINGAYTSRIINNISGPSLKTLCLSYVKIYDSKARNFPFLTNLPELCKLELIDVVLGDRGVELTSDMVNIKRVEFWWVKMSASGWKRFLNSLRDIQHQFLVVLHHAEISAENWSIIQSSPHFEVMQDVGGYRFTRVLPLTNDNDGCQTAK